MITYHNLIKKSSLFQKPLYVNTIDTISISYYSRTLFSNSSQYMSLSQNANGQERRLQVINGLELWKRLSSIEDFVVSSGHL